MPLQYDISNLILLYLVKLHVLFKIKPWHPGQDALNLRGSQWVKYWNILEYFISFWNILFH